jgi:hypothetical protein
MRAFALCCSLLVGLAGCGSEENYVLSGWPGAVISPVRSSMSGVGKFVDGGTPRDRWVVVMSDQPGLCTKITDNPNYFQTPTEGFTAILLWVPPGMLGTFFVTTQSTENGNAVLVGIPPADAGAGTLRRFGPVANVGGRIGLSQFDIGPGDEAKGSFDVAISDVNGFPREYLGQFKATFCPGVANANLPWP